MLNSSFDCLERITVIERLRTPIETFVDYAFSKSSTAPARIGVRAEELEQQLRGLMARFAIDGHVTETVELEALIGRRVKSAEV